MEMQVHYKKSSEVDKAKWDACINNSGYGTIYAASFFLNKMCTHWDALILNDYEAVMPLPWRKKWGIYYLYQPFITAQLGVFGKNISTEMLKLFLDSIPAKFKYWDITLNSKNLFTLNSYPLFLRTNYVLNLKSSYAEIYNQYRQTTKRNLKKSIGHISSLQKDVSVDKVISLNRQFLKRKGQKVSETDYQHFAELFLFLKNKNKAVVYGALSQSNELLAAAVFFFFQNRSYYILVGNSPQSKASGASHRVVDAFIQDHAGQNMILDFEGSDIESLAFFYSSFGAKEEKYAAIKYNCLPRIIRWLKQ